VSDPLLFDAFEVRILIGVAGILIFLGIACYYWSPL
jgi:hypothetical protein